MPNQCLTHGKCLSVPMIRNPGRILAMGMKIIYLVSDMLGLK